MYKMIFFPPNTLHVSFSTAQLMMTYANLISELLEIWAAQKLYCLTFWSRRMWYSRYSTSWARLCRPYRKFFCAWGKAAMVESVGRNRVTGWWRGSCICFITSVSYNKPSHKGFAETMFLKTFLLRWRIHVRDDISCKCNKINDNRRNLCTHFQQFVESLEPMLICYILEGRLLGKEDDIKLRLFIDRNNMNI